MSSHIRPIVVPSEVGDLAEDVEQLFLELGRAVGRESFAGECSPAIDVFETDEAIEIVVDLPGVDSRSIGVIIKGDDVLVAGEKTGRQARSESSFHLVERGFGRFARAVRLTRPCDAQQARAMLRDGELRVSIPKIADRRGRSQRIPIEGPPGDSAL